MEKYKMVTFDRYVVCIKNFDNKYSIVILPLNKLQYNSITNKNNCKFEIKTVFTTDNIVCLSTKYSNLKDEEKQKLHENLINYTSIYKTGFWYESTYNYLDNTCEKEITKLPKLSTTWNISKIIEYVIGRIGNPDYFIILKYE